MRARLRLFVDQDERQQADSAGQQTAMALGDFARVIADAVAWDRSWLQDFSEEHVVVSQDLYEIVRVYEEMQNSRTDIA